MAYVSRLIGKEEKLIGIGRLHYIYVIRGAMWLLFMTLCGVAFSYVTGMGLGAMSAYFDTMTTERSYTLTGIMLNLQHYVLLFCVAVGALFFLMYLVKYMVTEVALTSRRVIHKEGFIFVKVSNIDLEEVRGENLDTGWFGRMMNYGYLLLDCRFLGDVRLPALNKAEAFLKALHYHRSHTQDAVSVVVGKGNPAPVEIRASQPDISSGPAVEVNENQAAINPNSEVPVGAVDRETNAPVEPVKAAAPEQPAQPAPPVAPPAQPVQPPVTPPPAQPQEVPVTPPPQPQQPHTPPSTPTQPQQPQPEVVPQREIPQPVQPEILPDQAPQKPEIQIPTQASAKGVDPDIVAQVVSKVVPEIVKEMADKGIISNQVQKPAGATAESPQGEEELISAFDEAAFETKAKSVAENAKDKQILH